MTKPFRQRNAIIDVLDTKIPDSKKYPATAVATRALAQATVPAFVTRRERDGVVSLRWVADPCDATEAAKACTAHERWLFELLPSTVEPGYNEMGDLRMPSGVEDPPPAGLDLLIRRLHSPADLFFGHVAAAKTVPPPPSRTLANDKTLTELRLLASTRDAALSLGERVRAAGYDRVVYRGEDGRLWDPHPPGTWIDH